jgi:hypothetical protein
VSVEETNGWRRLPAGRLDVDRWWVFSHRGAAGCRIDYATAFAADRDASASELRARLARTTTLLWPDTGYAVGA